MYAEIIDILPPLSNRLCDAEARRIAALSARPDPAWSAPVVHRMSADEVLPVAPPDAMSELDWRAATPAVREAELLSLAQATLRNALRLGLFATPRTKAQAARNHQLIELAAGIVRRDAPAPIQRDRSLAAEDALRLDSERGLASVATGRVAGQKASETRRQADDDHRRANAIEDERRAAIAVGRL